MNRSFKPIGQVAGLVAMLLVADAQAVVGMPMTPVSAAGVARRHAVVATTAVAATSASAAAAANANAQAAAANANAQSAAKAAAAAPVAPAAGGAPAVGSIVTTLPPGCMQTDLNGVAYQRCGSTYYKPSMMGSNLVFVVAQP